MEQTPGERAAGDSEAFHLECPSGLAGDMFLGACLDLGLPLEALSAAVAELDLDGVSLEARRANRGGIGGVRFRVLVDGQPIEGPDPEEVEDSGESLGQRALSCQPKSRWPHRDYASIRRLISESRLASAVRSRSLQMFARLAEVEAGVHGVSVDDVHFHEVGAIDSIVDIVGACVAVETMAIESLSCGTIVLGSGTTSTEHGELPIPAPATAELLRGIPCRGGGEGELLTPTGALLIASLGRHFGPQPEMRIEQIGYGLGRWNTPGRANVCRLVRGRTSSSHGSGYGSGYGSSRVVQIETQVDDLSAEALGFAMERLLAAGCLDVFFAPIQMKKNRPGTLVTLLCNEGEERGLAGLLLEETGSLGCRLRPVARIEAERRFENVATTYGEVRVKIGALAGDDYVISPEYEDCRRLALEHRVPLRLVLEEARRVATHRRHQASAQNESAQNESAQNESSQKRQRAPGSAPVRS